MALNCQCVLHLYKICVYLEELLSRAGIECAVGDLSLLGKILCTLDGRHHSLHSEESCQVRRVRRDDDESEEPPNPTHYTTWQRPSGKKQTLHSSQKAALYVGSLNEGIIVCILHEILHIHVFVFTFFSWDFMNLLVYFRSRKAVHFALEQKCCGCGMFLLSFYLLSIICSVTVPLRCPYNTNSCLLAW